MPRSPGRWFRSLFARSAAPDASQRRQLRQPAAGYHPYAGQRVLPGISPKKLSGVLRAADEGNYDPFLLAAQELEERDAQYGSQMAVRRAAVSALELIMHKPSGASGRASTAVQKLIDSGELKDLIHYSLDAIGKGFSITEIVWEERRGGRGRETWWPTFEEHDPREFRYFDGNSGLMDQPEKDFRWRDGSHYGVPLEACKWVQHIPKGRSGDPIRRGTARPAMFLHMAKSMSLAGWIQLMAVFGLPIAIATAPQDLNSNDRAVLAAALAGLGQGVNAILPTGAEVKIVKAADAGSQPEKMFEVLLSYVDAQLSKLVLGQTMTSDDGSSQAQATVHNEVRGDIREGDAEQLAATINRDVVRPFVNFNFGEQLVYPEIRFLVEEARDLKVLAEATLGFMDKGLPVRASEVWALLGLTRPDGVDEGLVLGGATQDPGSASI